MPPELEAGSTTIGEASPASEGQMADYAAIMAEAQGDPRQDAGEIPASPPEATPPPQPTDTPEDLSTGIEEIFAPKPAKPADPVPAKAGRDYNGLDPEMVKVFKSMSNEAYNRLRPIYDEYSKGAKEKSDFESKLNEARSARWYETENAYQLAPEYSDLASNLRNLEFEENYWQEQLELAEASKPIQMLLPPGEDGKYRVSEATEVTPKLKAQLLANITRAQSYKDQVAGEMNRLKSTYQSRFKETANQLEEIDKVIFGKMDVKAPHIAPKYEKWISKLPSELAAQPVYRMLSKAMVVIESLVQQARANEIRGTVQKAATATASSSGPSDGYPGLSPNGSASQEELDKKFARMAGHRI